MTTNGTSVARGRPLRQDRKSTRLNSSHANISYAVFCLKKTTLLRHWAEQSGAPFTYWVAEKTPAAIQLLRFFFNDTATTEIYTLSLHDALPILSLGAALFD